MNNVEDFANNYKSTTKKEFVILILEVEKRMAKLKSAASRSELG